MKFDNMNYTLCDPCAGVGTMLLYAVKKCGYKKENCYGIELDELNCKILQKLGFVNIIQGDASDPKTWEKFGKDMKFDRIIMNPPYNGNLHLKILSEAIKHSDEVVNLSPIRWLQDPFAEYKNSAFKKFSDIREKIDSIEPVPALEASKLFNINIFSDLGICHIGGNNKVDTKNFWKQFKSTAAVMMIKKLVKMSDNIENHYENNKLDGIRVPLTGIGGNRGYKNVYKELSYVIDGKKDGKWWYECKNMGGYEKPAESPLPISIKFDTEVEAQNFYDSFFTKFYSWLCDITHTQQTLQPKYLPYLGDYTHPWTDEMLYDYFDLTQEEREIIENELHAL